MSTCAANTHIVYLDGKQVSSNLGNGIDSNQVVITSIPNHAQVIAISVTNKFMTFGGLRAAMSDGSVVSDSSWKCTIEYVKDWQNVDFDDSLWPAATTTGWAAICEDFPPAAKYLWANKYYYALTPTATSYCRKSLCKFCPYFYVETSNCKIIFFTTDDYYMLITFKSVSILSRIFEKETCSPMIYFILLPI